MQGTRRLTFSPVPPPPKVPAHRSAQLFTAEDTGDEFTQRHMSAEPRSPRLCPASGFMRSRLATCEPEHTSVFTSPDPPSDDIGHELTDRCCMCYVYAYI